MTGTEDFGFTEDIPSDEDGMKLSVQEYLENCASGYFIDYDGFGHPTYQGKMNPRIFLYPSDLYKFIPRMADGIVWFNR